MNALNNTTTPAALALALLGALFALTPQAIGQSANPAIKMTPYVVSESFPTPTRIVRPQVGLDYVGTRLEMTFWVNKRGIPYNIGCTDMLADRGDLVAQLRLALSHWQFTPAKDANGNPVARKVILPVTILPPKDGAGALVAFGYIK